MLWAIAAIMLAIILLILSFGIHVPRLERQISPEEFGPVQKEAEQAGTKSLLVESPQVEIKKTEVILLGADGSVRLRIRSDYAVSKKGIIRIPTAEFELNFKGNRRLYLLAKDLTYEVGEESASVSGQLYGEVTPLGQRFSASKLYWNRKSAKVILENAHLVDPVFEVRAEKITYDLSTNELEVEEGVEVNF